MGILAMKKNEGAGKLEDSAEFREISERYEGLQTKRREVDRHVQVLYAALTTARRGDSNAAISSRARELAGAAAPTGSAQVSVGGNNLMLSAAEIQREIRAATQERAAIDEALVLVGDARAQLRRKLSQQICMGVRPRVVELVAELARTMERAGALNDQLHELRTDLESTGVSTGALGVPLEAFVIGRLSDENSRVTFFLREAKAFLEGSSNSRSWRI